MQPGAAFAAGPDFVGVLTLHASTMVFVAMLPFALALHLADEGDAPAPRGLGLAVLAIAAGGLLMHGGLLLGSGGIFEALPRGGWAGDASLVGGGPGVDPWAAGLALSCAGLGFAAAATLGRALASGTGPESGPARLGWLAAAGVQVAVLPVLLCGLLALAADRVLGASILAASGDPGAGLWERAIWPRGNPLSVAAVLPGIGAAIAVVVAPARARLAAHAVAGAAVASLALWLAHAAAPEADAVLSGLRLLVASALAVALAAALPGRPAEPVDPAARAFARGSLLFLALAVATGALVLASEAGGNDQANVAHLHFAFVGAGLCGLAAGLYRAWPRLFGGPLDPDWGRAHAWVFVACTLATFGSLDALAALGMPRRVSSFVAGGPAEAWAVIASVASFALGGAFGFFGLVVAASHRGERARGEKERGAELP